MNGNTSDDEEHSDANTEIYTNPHLRTALKHSDKFRRRKNKDIKK